MNTSLDVRAKLLTATDGDKAAPSRNDGLQKVAREFENVFTRMMLKAMRDTVPESEFGGGAGGELYQDMLDGEYSKALSRGNGLGIADMLVRQFGGNPQPVKSSQPASIVGRLRDRAEKTFEDANDFVRSLWPDIEQGARKKGIAPQGVLAQAALETGWGQHVPVLPDGRSSYNLFGIKAGRSWQGERVARETLEFENGTAVKKREWFRAYSSPQAAIDDYFALLDKPRYTDVRASGDSIGKFAQALQSAGYATDPAYADKLRNVADGSTLRSALDLLKNSGNQPLTR